MKLQDVLETLMIVVHDAGGEVEVSPEKLADFYGKQRRVNTEITARGGLRVTVRDTGTPDPGMAVCHKTACPMAKRCFRCSSNYAPDLIADQPELKFLPKTPTGKKCPGFLEIEKALRSTVNGETNNGDVA